MALPPKKFQKAGSVDNQNTNKGPVSASPASTGQVNGAIAAFVKKKGQMSSKTKKRVAGRLKGMAGGK